MLKGVAHFFSGMGFFPYFLIFLGLTGCATNSERQGDVTMTEHAMPAESATRSDADIKRISVLERQLVMRQRHCLEEKRRQDRELKESLRRSDELQRKLDALLEIDRELRNRRNAD